MKTLTTLIAVVATSFTLNANAYNVDELTIGEIFPIQTTSTQSSDVASVSLPNEMLWGGEHEGFILNSTIENSVVGALLELENNPPAAGSSNTKEVFIWNDNAGEYHLQ